MADEPDSNLWRISDFQRARLAGRRAPSVSFDRPTLLPTTLMNDLQRLETEASSDDVLEVMAACLRHREPALLYLAHGDYVWPVTLFPTQQLYHSPLDASDVVSQSSLLQLRLITIEPPGVLAPGDERHERVGDTRLYRPLGKLFWRVALYGPRDTLLSEISGKVSYRLTSARAAGLPASLGALLPAARRLRQETATLREIAGWPGMSVARASRLLNALYLNGALMVTRSQTPSLGLSSGLRALFGRRP